METADVRNMILSTPLAEQAVIIPGWNANLLIRELSGKAGSDLINACTDAQTQKVNQDALIAGVILATLRNADDPNKSLVFSTDDPNTPNLAFRDPLMATGLGRIMQVAMKSISLSGLDTASGIKDAKNDLNATVVEGSLTH